MVECVEKAHRPLSEEDLEETLIDGPQPHPLVSENLADEGALPLPFQAALLRNAPHHDVVGILQLRHPARHRSARGGVAAAGSRVIEGFMRTIVIVLLLEALERVLLTARIALGRIERSLLERRVHTLVPAVVLRRGRTRALG